MEGMEGIEEWEWRVEVMEYGSRGWRAKGQGEREVEDEGEHTNTLSLDIVQ